jgi:hypothetical protein
MDPRRGIGTDVCFDMRIRLTKKLAQTLNGVDLSRLHVGDTIDMNESDAELLLMEGWAIHATENGHHGQTTGVKSVAEHSTRKRSVKRIGSMPARAFRRRADER